MSRALASIQKVEEIRPIKGKDRIELARVEGWWVIVQKGRYSVGDLLVYFEVDSVLPPDPRWNNDLERYKYRIKIMRMAGVYSQGYTMPVSELTQSEIKKAKLRKLYSKAVGADLTAALGVIKYEPDKWNMPSQSTGKKGKKSYRGNPFHAAFPSFIPKTEETRVQKLSGALELCQGRTAYMTEKLHGSSMTVYLKDGHFGVCSRNLELLRELPELPLWKSLAMKVGLFGQERKHRNAASAPASTHFWEMAKTAQLEEKMRHYMKDVALQGEIVGPGICDNIYKLDKHEFRVFSGYDIENSRYLYYPELNALASQMAIKMVPLVGVTSIHDNIDKWVAEADGQSELNKHTKREGLVVRTINNEGKYALSFKAVSQPWLMKYASR